MASQPETPKRIDVYAVGLFSDWKRRKVRPMRRAWKSYIWDYCIRQRHWRALRNYFNGYVAEPYSMPPGVTRCGRGWTKRAALRSLNRQIRRDAWPLDAFGGGLGG